MGRIPREAKFYDSLADAARWRRAVSETAVGGLAKTKRGKLMTDLKEIAKTYKLHQQAVVQANALNKESVFDALVAAGITSVAINFNGESDQGQIEHVQAYAGNEDAQLPTTALAFNTVSWNTHKLDASSVPLSEAIEALCYDYLGQERGGWENDDGAYGDFTFHVVERRIELDFHARFTDSTYFGHIF